MELRFSCVASATHFLFERKRKMKPFSKILYLLFCLLFLANTFSSCAKNETNGTENELLETEPPKESITETLEYFLLDDDTYAVIGANSKNLSEITIPDSYKEKPVTKIFENAFKDFKNLKTLIISESITSIGASAFSDCINLTNITIPFNVTTIDKSAFDGCLNITNANISTNVISAISKYNLKSVIINGGTNIADHSFDSCCNLTDVTILHGITRIGNSAFYRCNQLTNISIPESVISIGDNAFYGCCSLTEFKIPNSVTTVGKSVFANCNNLKNITIGNGITKIEDFMFFYCNFESISLPESVTKIGLSSFKYCTNLKSITLPENVTSIGDEAFYWCPKLTEITINKNVESIGSAFYCCNSLTNIYFAGTEEEWNAIEKANAMIPSSVTIHFDCVK